MIATDTITVKLFDTVGGLMAEVTGIPRQYAHDWIDQSVRYDKAREALQVKYPQLRIVTSSVQDDAVLFWVDYR